MSGAGQRVDAVVRRSPDGVWWVESDVTFSSACDFILAAGGRPYRSLDGQWLQAGFDGKIPRRGRQALDPNDWESLDLAAVLSYAPTLPARYHGSTELNLLVPAELRQWLIRRALSLGLQALIVPVSRTPLAGGDESHAMLIRLESTGRAIPASFVETIGELPYCLVGGARQSGQGALVVETRRRLPFPGRLLTPVIPADEIWTLGLPDSGSWRLRSNGTEVDGASLLSLADLPIVPVPIGAELADASAQIAIRLLDRRSTAPVDAVLLDDFELDIARQFLIARPLGEYAYIIPGEGKHLLTAVGGIGAQVPFGIPLVRMEGTSLLVELGKSLDPPMPTAALRERFGLDELSVVAVAGGMGYRFLSERLLPAWSLWVGKTPAILDGLSDSASSMLERVGEELRKQEREKPVPPVPTNAPVRDVGRVLDEAMRAEMQGDLRRAAELLESAGQAARAARLYERAARRVR